MMKMARVNTRISVELNKWLDEESYRTGVPKSTIIHLALASYVQQRRAVGSLEEIIKRLDRIEKKAVAETADSVAVNP